MESEQPQATSTTHPNQVIDSFITYSLHSHRIRMFQEYVDDLDRLLKAATHPRSTALLQKALEEAKREGMTNGTAKDSSGTKPRTAAAAARPTHKISQYGETVSRAWI